MNVAMEKTNRRAGELRNPYDAPTSLHKMIESLTAPSGTAANNRSMKFYPFILL